MQRPLYDLHWFIRSKPKTHSNQSATSTNITISHLCVNAGLVCVVNGAQDLLYQHAAPLHGVLELLILNKCLHLRQRCAADEAGHVPENGDNCAVRRRRRRKSGVEAWKTILLSFKVCVWTAGRTKPGSLLSSSSALQHWACPPSG